jgi:hypothetical protein
VIAALSLTPLVATRSKAQLALSQTLSRPHDDPDGDNEAPYVPSGTVAGLGVTAPAGTPASAVAPAAASAVATAGALPTAPGSTPSAGPTGSEQDPIIIDDDQVCIRA